MHGREAALQTAGQRLRCVGRPEPLPANPGRRMTGSLAWRVGAGVSRLYRLAKTTNGSSG